VPLLWSHPPSLEWRPRVQYDATSKEAAATEEKAFELHFQLLLQER
jgi:hypothetical protein